MEILLLASLAGLMIFAKRFIPAPAPFIPFLTMLALACGLYVGSLLGVLFYAALLAYALGLLAFVGLPLPSIVAAMRQASPPRASSTARALAAALVRTPIAAPVGAFALLYCLSWLVFGGQRIFEWDEFNWGLHTKVAIRYDDIFAWPEDLVAADYPRFGSLIQYFFSQFVSGGRFDEGVAILAQATIFAAAAAAFMTLGRIRFFAAPFICISFYFLVQGCVARPVSSLYQDAFLGVCWAMTLMTYLASRKSAGVRPLVATAIALFSLVQIKLIGVLLALFTVFIVSVDSFVFRRGSYRLLVYRVAMLAAVVVISHLSWSFAKTLNGIGEGQFVFDFSDAATPFELKEHQKETVRNFVQFVLYGGDWSVSEEAEAGKDFFELREMTSPSTFGAPFRPYLLFVGRVPVPLSIWLAAFVAFAVALCWPKPTTGYSRAETGLLLGLMASLLVVYACVICVLYVTAFSVPESVQLASVERYLGSAVLGVFLVLFFVLLQTGRKVVLAGFMAITLVLLPSDAYLRWKQGLPQGWWQRQNDQLKSMIAPVAQELKAAGTERAEEAGGPEGSVLVVGQPFRDALNVQFRLWLFPARVSLAPLEELSTGNAEFDLRDHDHLIIWNDDFWTLHGEAVETAGLRSVWQVEGQRLVRVQPGAPSTSRHSPTDPVENFHEDIR